MSNLIRLSDFVIDFFERKDTKVIFTVVGGGSIFLCDSLYKNKKIKYIACHHEQSVAYAAESYARHNNKTSVALVTTGPGGTNSVSGVASCWIDSVPVIFISGQVFSNQMINNSHVRQKGIQESNMIEIVKSITKFSTCIKDKREILYTLEKAYHIANSDRPGPVWIEIPADVQNSWIDLKKDKLRRFIPNIENKLMLNMNSTIKKIALKILKSKKPIIYFGGGAKIAKSQSIAKKIIDEFEIPFGLSWNAADFIETKKRTFIGKPGFFSDRTAHFSIQNCDLFISVGSRLNFGITGYNSKIFAQQAYKVVVDIDKYELIKTKKDIKTNLILKIDAKYFLEKLYEHLKKLKRENVYKPNKKWQDFIKNSQKKYPIITNDFYKNKNYVNSYVFLKSLSKISPKKSTLVTDMGLSFSGTFQYYQINGSKQKLYSNTGHAPMGWGLPGAIGAALADNKSTVICLTGDGGLQMNVQELATIFHYKLPIIVFVYNNNGYSTIRQTQKLGFKSRNMGSSDSDLSFPNYKDLAKAYNFKYHKINDNLNIDKMLYKIFKKPSYPILCELKMHWDQVEGPKLINRRTKDNEIAISTKFEDLYPFLNEKELKKNYLE